MPEPNHISVIRRIPSIDDKEMRGKMDLSNAPTTTASPGLLNWQAISKKRRGAAVRAAPARPCWWWTPTTSGRERYVRPPCRRSRRCNRRPRRWRSAFRPQDLIGRLGGGEFAICVNGRIDDERLAIACAGIVKRGVTFTDQYGTEHEVTLSIGGVEAAR